MKMHMFLAPIKYKGHLRYVNYKEIDGGGRLHNHNFKGIPLHCRRNTWLYEEKVNS